MFRPLTALVIVIAAGCGRPEPDDGRIHIRWLSSPDASAVVKAAVESFEKLHPELKVDMIEGPAASDARENMYSTSFMAKEDSYDLAYVDVAWVPKFAAQGWLRPLDDLMPAAELDAFLPGDVAGSRYEGKLYRVPVRTDGGMLYYRKDLLEAKGITPPRTWDELVSAANRTRTPEIAGFVFQGKQYEGLVCCFLELVWGFGGELLDASGAVRVDEAQAVAALEALVRAIEDGVVPRSVLTYQEEEARAVFQEGRAVFMRNWPYAWALMQEEGSPVRGKIGIAPMVAGPGGRPAAVLGGWGFAVSAYSKHPREAFALARHFASTGVQKEAFLRGGALPSRKALYSDSDVLKAAPHMKELGRVLASARPRPAHPRWPRMSDALQMHVSAALSLQEKPVEALKAAAVDIRAAARR